MKAVILAAGMGTRLGELTKEIPKSLLLIENKTLLERSLDNIQKSGIDETIVVTGYLNHEIQNKIGNDHNGMKITYVHSPEFSSTGSMHSLLQAKDAIGDNSIVLFESDLLYHQKAISTILSSPKKDIILVADLLHSGDDVYVCTNDESHVTLLGKNIDDEKRQNALGALVGISKYSNEFLQNLFSHAKEDYEKGEGDYHYEETVLSSSHKNDLPVHGLFCNDLHWIEVDNANDLKRAREQVHPKIVGNNGLFDNEENNDLSEKIDLPVKDNNPETDLSFQKNETNEQINKKILPQKDEFEKEVISYKVKRNILLNPGPATTTDAVKMAQVVPDICPREKEFGELMKSISCDLTKIAGGDDNYSCVLFGGSGTAVMDAAINSVVPPQKKLLVINNGAYGKRLADIARAYKIGLVELQYEWDNLPSLEEVELAIRNEPEVAVVAMIHHETTTGLLNPVKEIGALCKKYEKTFVVDTISSFAGVPLNIKEFNIDFMMSTSNKCIQAMAGACFIICNNDKLEQIKDYPKRSFYLNLYSQYESFKRTGQMRFTPPVQTLYALREAIDEFLTETYEGRVARYTRNWQVLREGVEKLGFKILTRPEDESHILITLLYPEDPNFNFDVLHDKLFEKGFTIYPGKVGKIDSFRLANMGAIDEIDVANFLEVFKEVLFEMGVKSN
jgi:2-aminoethylphosphonate-pyruvate transaminase